MKETVESRPVKRLVSVTVEVGQLAMVNPEQLKFSFEIITEGGPFEGAEMRVETLPAVAKCKCGFEGALGDEDYVCPKCGGITSCCQEGTSVLKILRSSSKTRARRLGD